MWNKHSTGIFWMELAGDEKRMLRDFYDFDQSSGGINPARYHTCRFETLEVGVVKLVSVAVAFFDVLGLVHLRCQ